jgi:uncharacterized membrane protein YsdA (DUF1294 family)
MEKYVLPVCLIYFAAISLVALFVTVYDKWAAKKRPKHRTPERTLLIISALGGSVFMYLTMKVIRHKTQHKKFMIGIPVIIFLQLAAIAALLLWKNGVI